MSVLVIADHNNESLNVATLSAITAANKLSDEVEVFVAGNNCKDVANTASKIQGVSRVLLCESEVCVTQLAENIAPLIYQLADKYSHLLSAATTTGKNLMPRVAALLDVAQISDIIDIESEDTFKRPIYAGNVIATVQSTDIKKVITVRSTAFATASSTDTAVSIETVAAPVDNGLSCFVSEELTKSERPELAAADVVISGGRGLGNKENFKLIEDLADCLGAAIGASRAAVDAGFVPNDYQVGQTGKIVAPKLYIAVGISGAIQHLAGMKDSQVIVAINKDAEAPIFQVTDYGIVGDLFKIVPELIEALNS
ncbi:MAG: electron transfer flavoprotein subunit alpha/FixB family protein [Proteobacteria bacterium]|nr:electron transfer flavoprotein subunit alpha/FixB family protein [Pseudomonadota bacterium]NOG59599.1 electron transfer flavoprotein subunit alpha/FixB family protein [Pseudomonadota bacterium]